MKSGSPTILLITPPLTQLNTPYPATAYLKGYLTQLGHCCYQADLGIELILSIFTRGTLGRLIAHVERNPKKRSHLSSGLIKLKRQYLQTIDPVIRFLRDKDPTLSYRISNENFLPEGPRFAILEDLHWAFGNIGVHDKARYLATLYLEDISDFIREGIDDHFGFSRYADRLSLSQPSFDSLNDELTKENSPITSILIDKLERIIQLVNPDIIGFTVPFPGCFFSALKCGQHIKSNYPEKTVVVGGGYINTELRELTDKRVFDYLDYILFDRGEFSLAKLVDYLTGKDPLSFKKDCLYLSKENTHISNGTATHSTHFPEYTAPDFSDLHLDHYLSLLEITNPMHRLWSDGRWNKMTIAHGCYWKKCAFCDTSLEYINRFKTIPTRTLVDQIETVIQQTGQTGFHFVDEAAPPKALKNLALEILRRGLIISWWTNIRFEKSFTDSLCQLMAASGCLAVSGGLEVVNDRLLKKMNKGISIRQAIRALSNFRQSGIMTHAYLMYGFPTQTEQETIDALEIVRQLFKHDLLQSGYWHRFSLTVHSAIAKRPDRFNITIQGPPKGTFARNDLDHSDPTGCEHETFGFGLEKSILNFMHGIGTEYPLSDWFTAPTCPTSLSPELVSHILHSPPSEDLVNGHCVWIGEIPELLTPRSKRGNHLPENVILRFCHATETVDLKIDKKLGRWLLATINDIDVRTSDGKSFEHLRRDYTAIFKRDIHHLTKKREWERLRTLGLLFL